MEQALQVLGKRLGKAMGAAAGAIRGLTPEQIAQYEVEGSIAVGGVQLQAGDLKVSGWASGLLLDTRVCLGMSN